MSHTRSYPSSLLHRVPPHWTCSSKQPSCTPACRLQDDRQRPNVETRHFVLQTIQDVASRNSLHNILISPDCQRVCQDTVRVRCLQRPFDDHLIGSDLEEHTEHAKHRIMCQSQHGPVFDHFDFTSLFGIVLQCNLKINSQTGARVAASLSP